MIAPLTILVADDDDSVRYVCQRTLAGNGHKVIAVTDGKAAIEEGKKQHFDLLVTDVVMPGGSGGQLAKELAALIPGLKILFMSGYTDESIVHHGMLSEGTNFIQKPFSIEALAEKIRDVLDEKK